MIVPRFTQDRCVILSDGSVESLLACAMASEQQQLAGTQLNANQSESSILLPSWWEWMQEIDLMISAVDPAVIRQASAYSLNIYPDLSVYPPDDQPTLVNSSIGSIQSRMLLEAAQIALKSGIRKVVWPIRIMRPETQQSMDELVDEIGITIDRAILASRLASLDATQDTAVDVVIETPFVDLSNTQIADLAGDMAIPLESCWWQNARTLPNAQHRFEYWSIKSLRSSTQIETKPFAHPSPQSLG
ncbi:MAG: hypothetical protein JKX70_03510 [Phycisphaerales bacterium]|nr:hypothetical protein [Phycisphaerales bacterium]